MVYFGIQNSIELLKIDARDPYVQIDIGKNVIFNKSLVFVSFFVCDVDKITFSHKQIVNNKLKCCKFLGIDGISPFNKSTKQLWPIMGSYEQQTPFLIACFVGESKPDSQCKFLDPLVDELLYLFKNGIQVQLRMKQFRLRCFCVDSICRPLICGTRYPTSLNGCPFCRQLGRKIDNVVNFEARIVTERTDHSFRERHDYQFHRYNTPLERLPINMITQIPLCSLHLLDLGVGRRILHFYIKKCMRPKEREELDSRLKKIKEFITSDFDSKTKPIKELHFLKGHDIRRFIVYEGPTLLENLLSEDRYNHFLLLHTAYRLLSMPSATNIATAKKLLERFVRQYQEFFPNELTFNVHCLLHFPDFVLQYGEPTNFSSYKFENIYQIYKKAVKTGTNIVSQIVNFETLRRQYISSSSTPSSNTLEFSNVFPDNYFLLKDSTIFVLTHINQSDKQNIRLTGVICKKKVSLYEYPINSKSIYCFKVCKQDFGEVVVINENEIKAKVMLLPLENAQYYAVMPLLHTYIQ